MENKRLRNVLLVFMPLLIIVFSFLVYEKKLNEDYEASIIPMEQETPYDLGPTPFDTESGLFSKKEIEYKGENYIRNSAVKAYLILGVDRRGGFDEELSAYEGGNADSITIVADNTADNIVKIIEIPRNTMGLVKMTDENGNVEDIVNAQITVAYAYGDGKEKSIEYMEDALMSVLDGFKCDGYMVGTLDIVNKLNDYIGGVRVKLPDDEFIKYDENYKKGEEILVKGKMAERFVRSRDVDKDYSAMERLDRQRAYVQGFEAKLKKLYSENPDILNDMNNLIKPYIYTDIYEDQYLKVGRDILLNNGISDENIIRIPGKINALSEYEEFYHDVEEIHRIIIDNFYRKK